MDLSKKINTTHIKKTVQDGGRKKLSPMSENYKKYLESGVLNQGSTKGKSSKDKSPKKINLVRKKNDPDIKIIHKKGVKNKHKFTRKKPSKINIKDINEIEKQIELSREKSNMKADIVRDIKKKSSNKKSVEKKSVEKKSVEKKSVEKKISRKNKKNKRRSNKKNISLKKNNLSQKDIRRVESKINEIRKKKTDDIKKELEADGIKVSGKSKRLLKDIYLYSKICNINIQHEK